MDTTCQDGNTPCLLILTPLRDRNSIFLICQTGKSRWTSRLGQTNVSCRTQLQCDSLVLSWLSAAMGTPPYSALESVGLSSIASIIVWDGNHWPLSGLRVSFFFFLQDSTLDNNILSPSFEILPELLFLWGPLE